MLVLPKAIYTIDTNATKYFPLNVGNTWVFEYKVTYVGVVQTLYKYKSTVLSDTVISSKKYFLISNLRYVTTETALYRVDSVNGAFTKFISCTVDSLGEQSFNSEYRNCTDIFMMKYLEMLSLELFSVPTTSIRISMNVVIPRITKSRYYAKNFGLYSQIEQNNLTRYYHTLIGCVINGVLYGDTGITVNGIVPVNNNVPAEFNLHQNYPNPFNPTTKIRFDVSGTSVAQTFLSVYDILGREVSILVNEKLQPGTYEADFDGSNYPSGIYFYKLTSHNFSAVNKMILLK